MTMHQFKKFTKSMFEGQRSRPGMNPTRLLAYISLWIATVGNAALWMELQKLGRLGSASDLWVALCMVLMMASALVAIGGLLAWRRSIKPLAIVLLIATGLGAHFMLSYGIVIDDTMMINVLHTDPRETRDLLNGRLALTLLLIVGPPLLWMHRTQVQHWGWRKQLLRNVWVSLAACLVVIAAIAASFQGFSSLSRNHKHLRYLMNPLNSLYALGQIAVKPLRKGPQPLQAIGLDAQISTSTASKPPLLLLVIGETARASNFSLSGSYSRVTTPELAKLAQNEALIYQKNAWSCGTNTAASVPCMFSHLGKEAFEASNARYEGLLDVLQRAGLAVLWIDNQSGCKGVCDRVANVNTAASQIPDHCDTDECHDQVMLHGLDQRIEKLPPEQRAKGVVIVMHQMGSHGPAYYKRVPQAFKQFKPECTTNNLSECQREQIINSYDNTLLYTDHFLASGIQWLKTKAASHQAAMMYVSDHGESLGEGGIYLHGLPYALAPDTQKHIPWFSWLSPEFATSRQIDIACMKLRADQRISHDYLFHSTLGMLNVKTSLYQNKLDLYSPCRR